MMAPYMGHFSPSSGELLTVLALSTHTKKSNVMVLTPQWTQVQCRQTENALLSVISRMIILLLVGR